MTTIELLAAYATAMTDGDGAATAALFCEDGTCEDLAYKAFSGRESKHVGRDNIYEFFKNNKKGNQWACVYWIKDNKMCYDVKFKMPNGNVGTIPCLGVAEVENGLMKYYTINPREADEI